MITLIRTNSEDPQFQDLVHALDKELAIRNGDQNDFFVQFNKIDHIRHVVLALLDQIPVGCGAIKEFSADTMEVKRMFVPLQHRGKGIALGVLSELETWAKELGYKKCVLETGNDMIAAVGLYQKSGYGIIPNYGQYQDVADSVCFEKDL